MASHFNVLTVFELRSFDCALHIFLVVIILEDKGKEKFSLKFPQLTQQGQIPSRQFARVRKSTCKDLQKKCSECPQVEFAFEPSLQNLKNSSQCFAKCTSNNSMFLTLR